MAIEQIRLIVRDAVEQLVHGEYESLVQESTKSRLSADDLRAVITAYGRTPVSPPSDAYEELDLVQITRAAVPTWSVRAPLWTMEEGRSDLTLELVIALGPGRSSMELDDLHVL